MRKKLIFVLSCSLFPIAAFSQTSSPPQNQPNTPSTTNQNPTTPTTPDVNPIHTPSPNPSVSPRPTQGYVILFHPELSKLLADSVHLDSQTDKKLENGCTITGASDGAITCLLKDSCNAIPAPICGISFMGSSGLSLSDVATLSSAQNLPVLGHVDALISRLRS